MGDMASIFEEQSNGGATDKVPFGCQWRSSFRQGEQRIGARHPARCANLNTPRLLLGYWSGSKTAHETNGFIRCANLVEIRRRLEWGLLLSNRADGQTLHVEDLSGTSNSQSSRQLNRAQTVRSRPSKDEQTYKGKTQAYASDLMRKTQS
jgi:hypothetical protein